MAYQRVILLALVLVGAYFVYPHQTSQNEIAMEQATSTVQGTKPPQSAMEPKNQPEERTLASTPQSTQSHLDAAKKLVDCLDSRRCAYSKEDPRSYDLAVGQALKKQLSNAYDRAHELSQDEIYGLIDLGAAFADGHVQSEALKLLEYGKDDFKNAKALLTTLETSAHDSVLMEKALKHMVKHKELTELQNFVHANIEYGGHYSSRLLAQKAHQFMTDENLGQYQNLLERLKRPSASYNALKASIDEYLKRQAGA